MRYTKKFKQRNQILFFCIVLIFFYGCKSVENYHNHLIEQSLVSEIPTLVGNLAGGICAAPFLLFSVPIGLIGYSPEGDETEEALWQEQKKQRDEVISFPIRTGATGGGIILGTPFFPLGLLFPRAKLHEDKEAQAENKKR